MWANDRPQRGSVSRSNQARKRRRDLSQSRWHITLENSANVPPKQRNEPTITKFPGAKTIGGARLRLPPSLGLVAAAEPDRSGRGQGPDRGTLPAPLACNPR